MLPSEYKGQQEKFLNELQETKAKGWPAIKETLTTLTRKRGLAKTVATALVELVYSWTLEPSFLENKENAIDVLNYLADLTEGKIFLEVIRARTLTRLADYKEADGDIEGAKKLLQDIQVEAFTSMDTREKTEFIIKQMRLILTTKDYVRVQIASRKLAKKTLDLPELEDLKIIYYEYLVAYHIHEGNYYDAALALKEIMETPVIASDSQKYGDVMLSHAILSILDENRDKAKELQTALLENPSDLVKYRPDCQTVLRLLESLLSDELTSWPLAKSEEDHLLKSSVFNDKEHEGAEKRIKLLSLRVLEKNLMIVSKTHTRVGLATISALLSTEESEIERVIVDLIGKELITAKIDRSGGIVTFGSKSNATPLNALDSAGESISSVLSLITSVVHQIDREYMLDEQRKVK